MDIMTIIVNVVLVLFLIFMNGFFVAAEFACVKIRPSRLETLIKEGNRQAEFAKKLTDNLDASLSVTQLGITLASLGLGWVGEPFVAILLLPVTKAMGFDDTVGHTISLAVAFFIITAGHIILGELTPKTMAIQNVESIMLKVALPLLIFNRVMYPFVWILNHMANWVARRMGYTTEGEGEEAHTEEEIRILMEESHKQGLIDSTEADFVDNVFSFTERNVREIMVPRTDMICLYVEDSLEENLQVAVENHMTRYPICRGNKDHVIGYLHIKDLLAATYKGERIRSLLDFARKVMVVPESMDVSVLLKTMQKTRDQLAVVVDEYGGTAGLVTSEDVIEELVGEIQDEFDYERPLAERRGPRVYSLDGRLLLEDAGDILEIDIEVDDVDTIGGWLASEVSSPPQIGQQSAFGGNLFMVEEVDHVRITRVLVLLQKELEEEHTEIATESIPPEEEGAVHKGMEAGNKDYDTDH